MLFSRKKTKETHDDLPLKPRVFAAPEGTRIYAVGDVHGRARLLAKTMATITRDAGVHPGKRIVEIYLGDYIDRGLESRAVIDLLLAPPPPGHTRICLKGNHEETLLRFLGEPGILRQWANFGGYATLASYGIPIPQSMTPDSLAKLRDAFLQALPPEHLQFLKSLKLIHSEGGYLFVHAGIVPGVALAQQKTDDLLWIRDAFLRHPGYHNQYIVHGHTPVASPELRPNRANLDVSAAQKESLCFLVVEGEERTSLLISEQND